MKIKLLSGAIAMCITCPAMAANLTTNQTYTCDASVLNDYSGTLTAIANFTPNSYTCAAGTYLPANATACATCPAGGSFCTGGTFYFKEDEDSGIGWCNEVSNADVSGITSDSGAKSGNDCYVSTSCPQRPECGPGSDSCEYEIDYCEDDEGNGINCGLGKYYPTRTTGNTTIDCRLNPYFGCDDGYTRGTTTPPTLPQTSQNGSSTQYHSHSGYEIENDDNDLSAGEWKVTWTSGTTTGTMKGVASCNNTGGTPKQTKLGEYQLSNSANGRFCWCKATTWTPSGGAGVDMHTGWVFASFEGIDPCEDFCAEICGNLLRINSDFRTVMFDSTGVQRCIPNTITINWGNGSGGIHATNSCTYGGSLNTPTTAPAVPRGYSAFTGWSFE